MTHSAITDHMKKDIAIIVSIVILGATMYALTLRGSHGNPAANQFKNNWDLPTRAFELSPERGRYVHVVSMAEHGTFELTKEWADVAYPDVGVYNGEYYSFFAPGVAYFTLPFYFWGSKYGLGQVSTFAAESLVSIITLIFIFLIARRIFKLPRAISYFTVIMYAFGSTSWSYAITLYQNAFTACFMVTSFYAVWRFSQNNSRYSWLYAAYAWLAYALAIFVDYPNALLMLPIMFYLAYSTFRIKKVQEGISVSVRWAGIVSALAFVAVTGLHFLHNAHYYGGWNNVAGTLPNYRQITATTTPRLPTIVASTSTQVARVLEETRAGAPVSVKEKTLTASFFEKNIPNGFYVLLFSDERGLLYFTPIFIISFFGIAYALRRKEEHTAIYIVPISLIALNLFLYASWGDPWGGWAYGPRYLIPSMTWLSLFAGVALFERQSSAMQKILAFNLFLYSSAVALLGALTTNAIPTKSEALNLPIKTFNFLKNIPLLQEGKSGSFMYKTYFVEHISLVDYFLFIYITIAVIAAITLIVSHYHHE